MQAFTADADALVFGIDSGESGEDCRSHHGAALGAEDVHIHHAVLQHIDQRADFLIVFIIGDAADKIADIGFILIKLGGMIAGFLTMGVIAIVIILRGKKQK